MPGHEKIVSVTIAPVKRNGISRPMFVTTGSSALRNAWRKITRRSETPFARAVFTKSWFSESIIADRMNRESAAMLTRTRVNTGSTRWTPRSYSAGMVFAPKYVQYSALPNVGTCRAFHMPLTGNHLRGGEASSVMSIRPSQNVGSEKPT